MKRTKIAGIIATMFIFGSSTVFGATPSINLQNNANNTVTVKVQDIQKDIYGIQVDLLTKDTLTEDVVFEPKDKDAYSFTVRDGNKLSIYITSSQLLDLGKEATLGNLIDMRNDQFLDSASYKVVDYAFSPIDTPNVDVDYTDENTGGSQPEQPEKPSVPSVEFADTSAHWASEAIGRMAGRGILKGYVDGTFRPSKQITRAEFSAVVARAFGFKASGVISPFKDVELGKWYTESVISLYEKNVATGRPDGIFGVSDSITNQEAAVMFARSLKAMGEQLEIKTSYIPFKDADTISPFAQDAVKELYEAGIINGMPDGTYQPKGSTTRAQVATMVDRILTALEGK